MPEVVSVRMSGKMSATKTAMIATETKTSRRVNPLVPGRRWGAGKRFVIGFLCQNSLIQKFLSNLNFFLDLQEIRAVW